MSKTTNSVTRTVEILREGAEHLKQADRFVRDRKFEKALVEIEKARVANPNNLYAIAYEERVRSLIPLAPSVDSNHSDSNNSKQSLVDDIQPALEQLSRLAFAQAQRSLEVEMKKEEERLALMAAEEEGRRLDELRRNALEDRVEAFIMNATEFQIRSDFTRALSELSRVFVLDSENERAKVLVSDIQRAMKEQEEVRERKALDEERRRREFLKIELAKMEAQTKEKQRRELSNRREAQSQKVREYVGRSKQLLAEGRVEEAIGHIAFVAVIDPLNAEVQEMGLEDKIRRRMEYEKDGNESRRMDRPLLDRHRLSINKQIQTAEKLLESKCFPEALRVVTRAYMIDPVNKEVQQCEERILEAQARSVQDTEADKRATEEHSWRIREYEWKQIEAAERARFERQLMANTEAKKRTEEEKIQYYLSRAWTHLYEGRYENALGEIALAFLVNPFDEEVRLLEEQIVAMTQKRPNLGPMSSLSRVMNGTSENPRSKRDLDPELKREDVLSLEPQATRLQSHVDTARRLIVEKRMDAALNELTQAFKIDPFNTEVRDLEHYVRTRLENDANRVAQQGRTSGNGHSSASVRVRQHVERARKELAGERYDAALGEIALAFVLDPLDEEVKKIEEEVLLARAHSKQGRKPRQGNTRNIMEQSGPAQIARHLAAADEFRSKGEFSKALEEIARAFVIDPLNESILRLDSQIQSEFQLHRQKKRTQ